MKRSPKRRSNMLGLFGRPTGGTSHRREFKRRALSQRVQNLEPRLLLASDFGDAPDLGIGTGVNDYETLLVSSGASHVIDNSQSTLFLGATVDAEDGGLQSKAALADDIGPGHDDEDGVLSPIDLIAAAETAPTINVQATNTTGSDATLYAWIDFNRDGVFDNATERAQTSIVDETTAGRFTITMPQIPSNAVGSTYLRLRLSTDVAAADPTGEASDGEVEDYAFEISVAGGDSITTPVKIASELNGGAIRNNGDNFGRGIVPIGDFNGDGVEDIVVTAELDDTGGTNRGAIEIHFMNSDGTVKEITKIASGTNGGPTLADLDRFGKSVAVLGDVDSDGVLDLAVAADNDDTEQNNTGAVYVLLMNSDATVKSSTKIASSVPNGPTLNPNDLFGHSIASLGDFDGDGTPDLLVGAMRDDTGGDDRGAMYVLLLNRDGSVKTSTKIDSNTANGPTLANFDRFGSSVTSLGDLNNDGVTDLAVGALGKSNGSGAVYVMFMNADLSISSFQTIQNSAADGLTFEQFDFFGSSVSAVGDLDADGIIDLAIGSPGNDTGGSNRGAVHLVTLQSDGTVKGHTRIDSDDVTLADGDEFGSGVAGLNDINGDGILDFAVGAVGDSSQGTTQGAIYVFMGDSIPTFDTGDAPDTGPGTGPGNYQTDLADNGPSHQETDNLFLGATLGIDNGVPFPLDLHGTAGTSPSITVTATNLTGTNATLSAWIDFNQDGVFDNDSERGQVLIPDDSSGGRFTVSIPEIPNNLAGHTYARFRLSTDDAGMDPTGPATDGEVEDYEFAITLPTVAGIASLSKIAHELNGGPTLESFDLFGSSLTSVGDVDGDGINDLAVGAQNATAGNIDSGVVYIMLMNDDGTARETVALGSETGGLGLLNEFDRFGQSIAGIGDLDGDGIPDLVVGANGDDTGGTSRGAAYVLFLNDTGTVKNSVKIADQSGGLPELSDGDFFGESVASLGDFDGDGSTDIVVGAYGRSSREGAVYLLMLNPDGTVKNHQVIDAQSAGGPALDSNDDFGSSVAAIGDLDGDGVTELAVGARSDDTFGDSAGAVHILFLNADGSIKQRNHLGGVDAVGPAVDWRMSFGSSLAAVGDLDGDGVRDLIVGGGGDVRLNQTNAGAIFPLFLNADGSVKRSSVIDQRTPGGPTLDQSDQFGVSIASVGDINSDGIMDIAVGAYRDQTAGDERGSVYFLNLEAKPLLDFGDAPDTGSGSSHGNYRTLEIDNGPAHVINENLFLGSGVDADDGVLHNISADADDRFGEEGFNDENGVLSKTNLMVSAGTTPTITILATNLTSSDATLHGWIDLNHDGVFSGTSERAQAIVAAGTNDGRIQLTFPLIPDDIAGNTYLRLRLSTDSAAASPVGRANDGEVEDYPLIIHATAASPLRIASQYRIGNGLGGFDEATLANDEDFGRSIANLGDIDGDGINDFAVGAPHDANLGDQTGAVYVLFMNADGEVRSHTKISDDLGGLPSGILATADFFGSSVAALGDIDGDGIPDMAVGTIGSDQTGLNMGAVHLLMLHADGTVKQSFEISDGLAGIPAGTLQDQSAFGSSLVNVGDLDGNGVIDLAVGAINDGNGDNAEGAVFVLMMGVDGNVLAHVKISDGAGGLPVDSLAQDDHFGTSLASIGDIDGDGIADLAVGTAGTNGDNPSEGAVFILFMNSNGSIKNQALIADGVGGLADGTLEDGDRFGASLGLLGDLDGDGINDLAVGATGDEPNDSTDTSEGAIHFLLLNPDGSVKSQTKISEGLAGFAADSLEPNDQLGQSLAMLGDLDGDGVIEIGVGAGQDQPLNQSQRAIYVLGVAPSPRTDLGSEPFTSDTASHAVDRRLFLGTSIDETVEGVLSRHDLLATEKTTPEVTLQATNLTGSEAQLSGWIDFNADGVLDNATERAQITVPAGTHSGRFTLVFPQVPEGSGGLTSARFRLSTDIAAEDPLGSATDGEVEDYVFSIVAATNGLITSTATLNSETTGAPALSTADAFGSSIASLGDFDGDGIEDVVIGAPEDSNNGIAQGAVYVQLRNADGSIKQSTRIDSATPGGPDLENHDAFGTSVAKLGDIDGDGIVDLAVGASMDDTGGDQRGAVHLIFLAADGTVKRTQKIASEVGGHPNIIDDLARFGASVTSLGDLDGDGVPDMAIGAPGDSSGGANQGSVSIAFMTNEGTVRKTVRISGNRNGGPSLISDGGFGTSLTNLGDVDGDGVTDIAVGLASHLQDDGSTGGVEILFLNPDGTVKSNTRIASEINGGPTLSEADQFGVSVTGVGDLDGDGVVDLAIGAAGDDTGGTDRGAIYLANLNSDGSIKTVRKIDSTTSQSPSIIDGDGFGLSVAALGHFDGDGLIKLAVGTNNTDVTNDAIHVLSFLPIDETPPSVTVEIESSSLNLGDLQSDVSIGFSEPIIDFDETDLTVTGGTLSNFAMTDSSNYTAVFTANDNVEATGSVTVASSYTDIAGNAGSSGTAEVLIDTLAPSVLIEILDNGLTIGETTSITFTFSEVVVGFDNSVVSVTGGTLSDVIVDTNDPKIFQATLTPTEDVELADATVSISTAYMDNAGNTGTADQIDFSVDTIAPTLNIELVDANLTSGETSLVTFTFSEPVIGFDNSILSVEGGTVSTVVVDENDPTVYRGIFTPTIRLDDATNVMSVSGTYTDILGNLGSPATSANYTIDSLIAFVTIDIADTRLSTGETTNIAFTFSEPVAGFDNSDLTIEGGTLSDVVIDPTDNTIFTGLFTPTDSVEDDTNVVSLTGEYTAISDGNVGLGADSENFIVDTLPPTLSITLSNSDIMSGETSLITFTFSEPVINFDDADVTVDGGTLSSITSSVTNANVYTAVFTPTPKLQDDTNVVTVNAQYTDAIGNDGSTATSANFTINTLATTVTIDVADSLLTIGETTLVTFTFSDQVQGFDADDVTVTNGTLSVISVDATDDKIYTASFTPSVDTENATNTIAVSADYSDLADNPGSEGVSNEFEIDTRAPTLSIDLSDDNLIAGETSTVTFTFTEAPNGFGLDDITVENAVVSDFNVDNADPSIFTALLTPESAIEDATNIVSVSVDYTDIAGNPGTVANSLNYAIDTLLPTLAIELSTSSLAVGQTATVTFRFSEAPVGFEPLDIVRENGTLSDFLVLPGDDSVYTATFVPTVDTEDLTNTIVVDGGYTDDAGNTGGLSASPNLEIDTLAPTLTISLSDDEITDDETATVTFAFSEPPVGFTIDDVTIENGSLSEIVSVQGNPNQFTATFTPATSTRDLTNVITVTDDYTDAAGNQGSSLISDNYTVDTLDMSLTISLSDTVLGVGETALVTFTFTKPPTGFDADDISADNGLITNFLVSDSDARVYTATFTPAENSQTPLNTISVSSEYTDDNGQPGSSAISETFTIDTLAPTVSIGLSDLDLIADETTVLTISFSEPPIGFTVDDLTIEGGSITDPIVAVDDPSTFTATFIPNELLEDESNTISIRNQYTDAAGNPGVSASTSNFTVDTVRPSVAITFDKTSIFAGQSALVTFTPNQTITGLDDTDLSVTGGTLSAIAQIGDTNVFNATLTTTSADGGTASIILATTYEDAAGNSGEATTANLTVVALPQNHDYGDAPDGYPVTFEQNGARHPIGNLFLGPLVDADIDGVATTAANGDTDDGVRVLASIIASPTTTTQSSFAIVASQAGRLDGWIDFNHDGDWDDAGEHIFDSTPVVSGSQSLAYTIPIDSTTETELPARFRISTSGDLDVTGAAIDGEVEDYLITLEAAGTNRVGVETHSPGLTHVETSGDDLVVRQSANILFRGPATEVAELALAGTDENDVFEVRSDLAAMVDGLDADGNEGSDTLRIAGQNQFLDLTTSSGAKLTSIETIDIRGNGANRLRLAQSHLTSVPGSGNELEIIAESDDTVEFTDGDFVIGDTMIIDNQFVVSASNGSTNVTIAGMGWTNPIERLNVDASEGIEKLDALLIINELNRGSYVQSGTKAKLIRPEDLLTPFPMQFLDTSGDGNLTALDALRVINFLNEQNEQQTQPEPFAAATNASAPESTRDKEHRVATDQAISQLF